MCDQSEIAYLPNEIVWVKLGPVWWPGEVQDYNALPEEITGNLRKQPIAVVKFFQEDSYEYIKNLNHIYRYNCLKKNEFIRKGLDLCRSANSRDVPSNMKMFPADIVTAEKQTGGDPDILQSELFTPKKKESYTELFATPKKPSGKEGSGSGRRGRPPSEAKANAKSSLSTPVPAATPSPRSITHPRFVGRSNTPDYESRIRQQPPPDNETGPPNVYRCHACDFSTVRLNVIVLHNKSHTGTNVDFSPKNKEVVTKKSATRTKLVSTPKIKQTVEATKRKLVNESPSVPKRANTSQTVLKKEIKNPSPSAVTPSEPKSVAKKRGPKPTKSEKLAKVMKENETIRDDLLKDWDDEDEMAEEEEKSKQYEDKTFGESEDEDKDKSPETKENVDENTKESVDENIKESVDDQNTKESVDDQNTKPNSCFDFDESEDGGISPKKPVSFSRKSSVSERKIDSEVEEFGKKVDDLLSETVVPELPFLKLPEVDSKKTMKSLEFDENLESNEIESKSVDSEEAAKNVPMAVAEITDSDPSDMQKSQTQETELINLNTELNNEHKPAETEFEVKSPQSANSLVIDFDVKPIRQRRCSNQNKVKPAIAASCPTKPVDPETPVPTETSVTSSESVEAPVTEIESASIVTAVSSDTETADSESILTPENIVEERNIASEVTELQSVSCKTEAVDGVSSSSDRITAELVPKIKKEPLSSNELSVTSAADMQMGGKTVGGAGRRGRLSGSRMIVAKPATPQPSVTSTRRRSMSKKDDNIVAASLIGQEEEMNSSSITIGQDITIKNEVTDTKPLSTIPADVVSANPSQLSDVDVVSETVLGETIVVGGELLLNPDGTMNVNSDQNASSSNCNLDFDINSMPIEIDNNEYTPSSISYEEVETMQTISSSTPIEIAPSVAAVKVEPKTVNLKNPSSFLEKALISNESNAPKAKSNIPTTPKKTVVAKSEKGTGSKVVMPLQTSSGPAKMKTVKLPSGTKFFSPNSKSSNQFLLLKTSTGQQILKSSHVLQQSDGRMIIVTQNQSPRSGLVVKNLSKGEQLPAGKFTTSRIITSKGIVSSSAGDVEGASSSKQAPNILSKVSSESSKNRMPTAAQGGARQKILSKVSGVAVNNSVNLSPANISGKVILPGKQGGMSKVFLSKSGGATGTKFVMHSSPTKVSLPPSMRQKLNVSNASPGNILVPGPARVNTPSTVAVQSSATKVLVSQVSSPATVSTVPKVVKVQKQGPNILQKQQRKSMKTVPTAVLNKVVGTTATSVPSSSIVTAPTEPVILPSTSVGIIPNSTSSVTPNVVYVAMDNNTYQAVDSSMLSFDASQQPTQTLYINPGTTNLENILLTIDEKGNVNLAQQTPQLFTSEVPTPTQDILAKALADTQVLQTEASIADAAGRVAYIESLPYPAPPVISNVQETSLTLNQPIMTPLEVPSSATPLPSNFNLITREESADNAKSSQDLFITHLSGVPSSNIAFQITVNEDLVAASSDPLETNIDEDLIKINKPLKPVKKLIKSEDTSKEQECFATEIPSLENKVQVDSSQFIISEVTVSDSIQSNFVDSKENPTQVLPGDLLPVSSNGQSEMVQVNEASSVESDTCNSVKEEVNKNNVAAETEVVNGVSSDCTDGSSVPKITKDLNFPCQESEKI